MIDNVWITDTTLRDGEQAAGVAFTTQEKVEIAVLLDQAGVNEIECGIPAMGGAERDAVKAIASLGTKARVSSWNRAVITDIQLSLDCGVGAVTISLPVSDFQINRKLGKSRHWILTQLTAALDFAKENNLFVCVGAEDASRADEDFLTLFAQSAHDAGADRLRFSDTLGIMEPFAMYERILCLTEECALPVEIHTHNDYGLALANSLAAVRAGVRHVSATALGLGERAGNTPLEELALAIQRLLGMKTDVRLHTLPRLCKFVAQASGRLIAPGKPVVGAKVFSHESEIHAAGMLLDPGNYEPYSPDILGLQREIVIGKHTGKRGLAHTLTDIGAHVSTPELLDILRTIRDLSPLLKRNLTRGELLLLCGLRRRS